jgi:hypothetical protein
MNFLFSLHYEYITRAVGTARAHQCEYVPRAAVNRRDRQSKLS